MAQKPHRPDDISRAKVEALVVAGVTQDSIAKVMGVDAKTLRKYYHDDMETALQKVIGNISNTLVQKAVAGDTASIIFFLKARAGWSERQLVEHSGALTVNQTVDRPPRETREEWLSRRSREMGFDVGTAAGTAGRRH